MNTDDRHDYETIKQMLDRLGKAILMSADKEMGEIIRRRLFEWHGLPDEGRKTAAAYSEWAVEHAQELTGIDADTAYELFQSAYPFHPAVLRVFEAKWSSIPRFQRTRGVLRMLALWVSHAFQEEHRKAAREPLITLGLAPLENPTFRAAIFEQLGSSELEIPVTTDITGKADAHAVRLDKEATDAIRQAQLHRKVATTIFFESNGGMSQAKADASVPEIKTGVCGPEMNMVDVDNVLEGLAASCFYLNWERNRYRFGLSPNLNQILVTRRGAVQDKAIDERIKQQTQKLFDKHSVEASKQIDRKYWPDSQQRRAQPPGADPGRAGLGERRRRTGHGRADGDHRARLRIERADIQVGPDLLGPRRRRQRPRRGPKRAGVGGHRRRRGHEEAGGRRAAQAAWPETCRIARRDLDEAIFRAYRHVYLLGKDNKLRHVDLGQITSSSAASLVELILRELERNDEVTAGVSPGKLVKYWPRRWSSGQRRPCATHSTRRRSCRGC